MGEVYLVQHPRLPRLYALKVLPAEAAADSDYRSRFNREADLAADLYHPNIVGVHDRGEFNGQLWIAMDYVEGSDCDKLLRQRYPAGMPTDQAIEIITAVAEALDYAHQRGLLHRDVKPANILLTQAASAKSRILLADFGIARQLGDAQGLTATNMVLGTVNYAAPEQLMGEPLDGRADQYALAVTAYQLLTGTIPFQNSNPAIVISHKLNRDVVLPTASSHNAALVPLDPVFAAALANAPASRFANCSDFASALATACGRSQTSAEIRQRSVDQTMPAPASGKRGTSVLPAAPADRTTNSVPTVDPAPRARRGTGLLIAAGVLVAMLIAIGAVVTKTHPVDPKAPIVSQPATLTFDSMKSFVTAHYDKLPANTADTWSELDDHYKNRTGRQAYDEFWATIEVVKLLAVRPRDANSVTVTLKYFKKNGDTDTEDRWLSMVVNGGKILIDDSERVQAAAETPVSTPPTVTTPLPTCPTPGPGDEPQYIPPCTPAQTTPQNFVAPGTRYAFPAHYSLQSPAQERPSNLSLNRRFYSLSDLTWTKWGADGADGSGQEHTQTNCDPTCANGAEYNDAVQIHASHPQPALPDSGCPTDILFYSDIVLSYPNGSTTPHNASGDNFQWTNINGIEAIHYWNRVPTCEP